MIRVQTPCIKENHKEKDTSYEPVDRNDIKNIGEKKKRDEAVKHRENVRQSQFVSFNPHAYEQNEIPELQEQKRQSEKSGTGNC